MNGKEPWISLEEKLAKVAEAQEAAARQIEKTGQEIRETDRQLRETDRQLREMTQETDRQLRELGKQIGGLGDKFGSFTEGLALPSMTKILMQDFGMQAIAPRMRVRNNGRSLEVDVLAWSENRDEVYAVEVKSHLREDALDQMRGIVRRIPELLPNHRGKKIYGILAAVDIPEDIEQKALREGFYLARIHDGQFELQIPEGFQPRAFQA